MKLKLVEEKKSNKSFTYLQCLKNSPIEYGSHSKIYLKISFLTEARLLSPWKKPW